MKQMAFATLALIFVLASAAFGQTTAFTYHGQLSDANGPVTNPSLPMSFQVFDALTGGNALGSPVNVNANVQNGLFALPLDFGLSPFSAGARRWLEVTVNGSKLSPREEITPVPYALFSQNTRGLSVDTSGRVGIGTSIPVAQLDAESSSSGTAILGIIGTTNGSGGTGVYGDAIATSGTTYGVYGQSQSPGGYGVFGTNNSTTGVGLAIGVRGQSASYSGTGVYGNADATSGITYGVYGQSKSPGGYGVYGINSSNAGVGGPTGVYGQSNNSGGTGIYGTGGSVGVYGENPNSGTFGELGDPNYGVYGINTNSGNYGEIGAPTYGAFGYSAANYGVAGVSGGASGYGVFGQANNPSGYGIYSSGRFAASGTKSFQIDHPMDPANQYLNHYCAEGPEPLNLYSGNVITDAKGYATIALPAYFESINKDFRYQLTVIDSDDSTEFVQAKVVREIQNNQFTLRTSAPKVKVSWRVEGVRNDAWVQKYGAPIEQAKPDEQRGKYLNPELYNQPKELGIHFQPEPKPISPPKLRPN